jgi:predicted nucleotidyltransferase
MEVLERSMPTETSAGILSALRAPDLWSGFAPIIAAYAFGSRCTGKNRPDSDLDVGVLLDRTEDRVVQPRLLAELEARLQRRAGRTPIDFVILNDQALAFQYIVVSKRQVLYERSRGERVSYEAALLSRYFDFLPTLELFERHHSEGIRRRLGIR